MDNKLDNVDEVAESDEADEVNEIVELEKREVLPPKTKMKFSTKSGYLEDRVVLQTRQGRAFTFSNLKIRQVIHRDPTPIAKSGRLLTLSTVIPKMNRTKNMIRSLRRCVSIQLLLLLKSERTFNKVPNATRNTMTLELSQNNSTSDNGSYTSIRGSSEESRTSGYVNICLLYTSPSPRD